MDSIKSRLLPIIFLFATLAACGPDQPGLTPSATSEPTPEAIVSPVLPSPSPLLSPTPLPTMTPQPTVPPTPYPDTWAGIWNVWIGNPKISIVNTVVFEIDGNTVRSEWYEGTRQVVMEAILSPDGSTITGTLFNSDVEALPIYLTLSADAGSFTGVADSEAGPGQFCGTRADPMRPEPCRGTTP